MWTKITVEEKLTQGLKAGVTDSVGGTNIPTPTCATNTEVKGEDQLFFSRK